MKTVLFGALAGIVSGHFGLFFMEQPLKYCIINGLCIAVFQALVYFLEGKKKMNKNIIEQYQVAK
jgi:hypothetical protein